MDQLLSDGLRHDEAEEAAFDDRPPVIDAGERRMHVRAHTLWLSLLGGRAYPTLADLDAAPADEFAPYAVLLDFTRGGAPAIARLGEALARAGGFGGAPAAITDVSRRSLLGRVIGEYPAILANRAPIGFEAEFVDGGGARMLYRGILMPFSSDGERIDYVYGVVSWKALADPRALAGVVPAALPALPGTVAGAAEGATIATTIAERLDAASAAARRAHEAEVQMRAALLGALGLAHDLLLAADADPPGFRAAGVAVPTGPRAIVATLFGDDLAPDRAAELADALAQARRIGVPAGGFARHAEGLRGGLRAMIAAERGRIG